MSQDSTNPPTPRDALAAIVYRVNNPRHGDYSSHQDTADAILAAGWTPPVAAATYPNYDNRSVSGRLAHLDAVTSRLEAELVPLGFVDKPFTGAAGLRQMCHAPTYTKIAYSSDGFKMTYCPAGEIGPHGASLVLHVRGDDVASIVGVARLIVAQTPTAAGWRPPADDTETEWGVRHGVDFSEAENEADARKEAARWSGKPPAEPVVVRRSVGPWEEQS